MIMVVNGHAMSFENVEEAEKVMFERLDYNKKLKPKLIHQEYFTEKENAFIVAIHIYQYYTLHQETFIIMR